MKIAALVLLSSALILTSCGKKGDDKKSDSTSTTSTEQDGVLKEGTLVNGKIDLHKEIRGTSWTLSKIVDLEDKEVADAKKTELSFDKDKNILNIINANGNNSNCGVQTGGEYQIVKSSNPDEYFIQKTKCFTYSDDKIKYTPPMAIIKINKDESISMKRDIYDGMNLINGKIIPIFTHKETYTKK